MRTFVSTLAVLAIAASAAPRPKLKVIVDQDARGPCTTDISVYRGAVFPLVHTQEEATHWESLYGELMTEP